MWGKSPSQLAAEIVQEGEDAVGLLRMDLVADAGEEDAAREKMRRRPR